MEAMMTVDESQPGGSGTGKRTTMRAQLTQKEAQIADLEATVLDLRSTLCQLQEDFNRLRWDNTTLENDLELTSAANKSLKSLKRKADATFLDETQKQQKRYKRLQTTRDKKAESTGNTMSTLNETIDGQSLEMTNLTSELAAALEKILARDEEITRLHSHLKDRQSTITALRNRLYASQKQNTPCPGIKQRTPKTASGVDASGVDQCVGVSESVNMNEKTPIQTSREETKREPQNGTRRSLASDEFLSPCSEPYLFLSENSRKRLKEEQVDI
ncbi:hypothetical protein R3P38DRAFT_3452342 [Favolaschia claudopus]|uniref:Uncharacterized protein n=1 Tax=Favolaschia claudopus TaxID=2862362 RepID=A0AAV9ZJT8_9AGAR